MKSTPAWVSGSRRIQLIGLSLIFLGLSCLAAKKVADRSIRVEVEAIGEQILDLVFRNGDLTDRQRKGAEGDQLRSESWELADRISDIQNIREHPFSSSNVAMTIFLLSTGGGLLLLLYSSTRFSSVTGRVG